MTLNPYITSELQTHGSLNEQALLDELVEESIKCWGQKFYYIPRVLVAKDNILGEDRLSRFKEAYPIEAYVESPNGFAGAGEFIAKFGLHIEQSLELMISRKRWREVVGRFGKTILPTRPAEGDLLYYPMNKRLFEIKFAAKDTFNFQLGGQTAWKLTIELFQYASERLTTGIPEIDGFETLKTYDQNQNEVERPNEYGYNHTFREESDITEFKETNPFGSIPEWNPDDPFGED